MLITFHCPFFTQIYVCGKNHSKVFGINPPPEQANMPVRVASLKEYNVVGIAAGACHTVFWTSKNALLTCGTNAGQLGLFHVHILQY